MISIKYQYPGDPVTDATLMFGAEFTHFIRGDRPAQITIGAEVISMTDIICDECSAQVWPTDPCAHVAETARLYCWACVRQWVLAHIQVGSNIEVLQ